MSTRKRAPKSSKPSQNPDKSYPNLIGIAHPTNPATTATPPARSHAPGYHWPQLLDDKPACKALLSWFTSTQDDRSMPWRSPFLNPETFQGQSQDLESALARRAYQIWVSEVMLQQTRVSTVIPYFTRWVDKWPTVEHLAAAQHEDVLGVWKGLGYYSRATRLWEGAREMVEGAEQRERDGGSKGAKCAVPSSVQELLKVPGIGRYTAGAISSIAFGEPEPVLDGNVARVLSRQLGLYADVKDKKTSEFLWRVADALVKSVAGYPDRGQSEVPGQWNQGLMELGSTVCTPKPKCAECPIRGTCRAFAEGEILGKGRDGEDVVRDIEDACDLCEELDTEELVIAAQEAEDGGENKGAARPAKKKRKNDKPVNTISHYFGATRSTKVQATEWEPLDSDTSSRSGAQKRKASPTTTKTPTISPHTISYCSLFPKKTPKKKAAEESCVVCMIEARSKSKGSGSRWLIEQRPASGLLASLWQFPQHVIPSESGSTPSSRKSAVQKFMSDLDLGPLRSSETNHVKHLAEVDTMVHVFTHLRLTMHIHRFLVEVDEELQTPSFVSPSSGRECRWIRTDDMSGETLSTGMRRCWDRIVEAS